MSAHWLPPLTALRAFEALGRLGNVKDAARELSVTVAAVHYQIRGLEQHLGTELCTRTRQGLILTKRGTEFLRVVSDAFDELSRSARQLQNQARSSRLIVECLSSFANSFLLPRLPRFKEAFPDIQLELQTRPVSAGRGSFEDLSADVAIRASCENVWPRLHAEKLLHLEMTPVCSPALLLGKRPLRTSEDLAGHRILMTANIQEGWTNWFRAAETMGSNVPNMDSMDTMRFDQIHMSMIAAVQNLGVDLGYRPLVNDAINRGLLVEPFDIRVTTKMAYWLVCPPENSATETVRKFSEWLRTELDLSQRNAPLEEASPAIELALARKAKNSSFRAAE